MKFSIVFVMLFAPMLAQAADKFSYKGNAFIERDNCLGAYRGTSLAPKEEFRRFLRVDSPRNGDAPVSGKITHTLSAEKAKEKIASSSTLAAANDNTFWAEAECFQIIDSEGYETMARLTPEYGHSLGIAIRNLPKTAWATHQWLGDTYSTDVKYNSSAKAMDGTSRAYFEYYVKLVRHLVTDDCYAPDSRIEYRTSMVLDGALRVQPGKVTHLVIGKSKKVSPEKRKQLIEKEILGIERIFSKFAWPEYKMKKSEELKNVDFYESAGICRFFLDGPKVLKAETFSHVSGVDKNWGHDVQLDSREWPYLREDNLGFISLDEGKNWDIVQLVYGMETINYWIRSLDNSSVMRYDDAQRSFR